MRTLDLGNGFVRSSRQFIGQNLDERVNTLVDFPKVFDFRDGVENRRVVPALITPGSPGAAQEP